MLMVEGLQPGEGPEMWNLYKPEAVQSVHKRYFEAGATVVLTNTFGANRSKLKKRGSESEVARINTRGAELATGVCPPGKLVAGDIGPSGELIAPLGKMTAEDLEEVFAEQAQALIAGGVDLIVVETMFSLEEALAALRGIRRVTEGPVFVSMTYERKEQRFFTMMGETPEACNKALEKAGANGVGANCTLGSRDMIVLARVLRRSTRLPVVVQPNAGDPRLRDGQTVYDQKPEAFAADIQSIVKEGVNGVGGCCGTTPEFLFAVHQRLFSADEMPIGVP
jgi:methionine synthase I (cobalamin-dependent)